MSLVDGRGWTITCLDETESTNRDMAEAAKAGAAGWSVEISDYQSGGRGRFERRWIAPRGTALATSLLIYPTRDFRDWGWLSLIVGMAITRVLSTYAPGRVELKWPNDVLIGNKKVCGILSERVGEAAICGWGLNIDMTADQLPVPTATSLLIEKIDVDRTVLCAQILTQVASLIDRWESGDDLTDLYQDECATIGRRVAVHLDQDRPDEHSLIADAIGIDRCGALIVVDSSGSKLALSSGDVVHIRKGHEKND